MTTTTTTMSKNATTTTYSINCTDTDAPAPWMSTPGIVSMTPGPQDSGRCAWRVVTTDPAALTAAFDDDDTVLEYEALADAEAAQS